MKVSVDLLQKWKDLYVKGDVKAIHEASGFSEQLIRVCLKRGEYKNQGIFDAVFSFYNNPDFKKYGDIRYQHTNQQIPAEQYETICNSIVKSVHNNSSSILKVPAADKDEFYFFENTKVEEPTFLFEAPKKEKPKMPEGLSWLQKIAWRNKNRQ